MKYLFTLICFLLLSLKVVGEDRLVLSANEIKSGESINLKFYTKKQFDSLEVYIYESKLNQETIVRAENLYKQKDYWEIKVNSTPDTQFLFFNIRNQGELIYANKDDFVLFNNSNEVESESLALLAKFNSKNYAYYLKIEGDNKVSLEIFKNSFKKKPELKRKYFVNYLYCFELDSEINKMIFKDELDELANSENLSATELGALVSFYSKLGMQTERDNIYEKWIKAFPEDLFVLNMEFRSTINDFNQSKGFNQKKAVYLKYLSAHENYLPNNKKGVDVNLMYLLGNSIEEYISEDKFNEWEKEVENLDSEVMLSTYFMASRILYNKNNHLEIAKNLANKYYLKKDIILKKPRDWREPLVLSDYDMMVYRKKRLAPYFNTYGSILSKLNLIDSAKIVLRQAVFELSNLEDETITTNYLSFIEKHFDDSFLQSEKLRIKSKNDETFDISEKRNVNFQLNRINLVEDSFPKIEFNNRNGEKINNEDFERKIIILDFWATWCGACWMEFIDLKKLEGIYSDNPQISFYYINTKESENISQQDVLNTLNKKGVDINVLFDTKNLSEKSLKIGSLPTILILDGKGKIRYKQTGYSSTVGINNIYSAIEQLLNQNKNR